MAKQLRTDKSSSCVLEIWNENYSFHENYSFQVRITVIPFIQRTCLMHLDQQLAWRKQCSQAVQWHLQGCPPAWWGIRAIPAARCVLPPLCNDDWSQRLVHRDGLAHLSWRRGDMAYHLDEQNPYSIQMRQSLARYLYPQLFCGVLAYVLLSQFVGFESDPKSSSERVW